MIEPDALDILQDTFTYLLNRSGNLELTAKMTTFLCPVVRSRRGGPDGSAAGDDGVEGGDHPAFKAPPYYDPRALTQDRIIIAAFGTAENLPTGKTRVARIHVRISGEPRPDFGVQLIVAADQAGDRIRTSTTVSVREPK